MWMWEAAHQPKAVVVLVHSVFEHHRRYAWLIETFRENNFHVVMGDLPGHGEQAKLKTMHNESIGEYDLYLERAIDYAAKMELPIFLAGHGFGATTILHYMRKPRESVAGILLTSPWIDLQHTPSKWTNRLAKLTISQKLNFSIPAELYVSQPELIEEYKTDELIHDIVTTDWYSTLTERMKHVAQSSSEWTTPVWLQVAGEDELISIKAVRTWVNQQRMQTLHYSEWPGMKHDLHQESDREFLAKSAIDFLHLTVLRIGYVL